HCLAWDEKCIPDDPDWPDGPKHPTGKLHRLLWETLPETKGDLKVRCREVDVHMKPFYAACRELGLPFLRHSEAIWSRLCEWSIAAKNGHKIIAHMMMEIFGGALWAGKTGRPETLTPKERKDKARDRKRKFDAKKLDVKNQMECLNHKLDAIRVKFS